MKKLFFVFLVFLCANNFVYAEKFDCPSAGIFEYSSVCCKDGYAYEWDDKKNDYISYIYPELCGCPDGGIEIDGACCKNNLLLDIQRGDSKPTYAFADPLCGCPKGGYVEKERCCLNGKGWSKVDQDYTKVEAECGCPDGGYAQFLNTGSFECCRGGYFLNSNGEYRDWDWWGTCECQWWNLWCYLRQFKDRVFRRIKGINECCA